MKIGELARQLGLDRSTIHKWLDEERLHQFLTKPARGEDGLQRVFSGEDVDVINTIRHLKYMDRGITWDEIIAELEKGKRIQLYPSSALRMDSRVVTVPEAESAVENARLRASLAAFQHRVEDLEARLAQSEREKREIQEKLLRENQETKEKLLRENQEAAGKLLRENQETKEKLLRENQEATGKLLRELGELKLQIGILKGKYEPPKQSPE